MKIFSSIGGVYDSVTTNCYTVRRPASLRIQTQTMAWHPTNESASIYRSCPPQRCRSKHRWSTKRMISFVLVAGFLGLSLTFDPDVAAVVDGRPSGGICIGNTGCGWGEVFQHVGIINFHHTRLCLFRTFAPSSVKVVRTFAQVMELLSLTSVVWTVSRLISVI